MADCYANPSNEELQSIVDEIDSVSDALIQAMQFDVGEFKHVYLLTCLKTLSNALMSLTDLFPQQGE